MFVLVFDDHTLTQKELKAFFGSCVGSEPLRLNEMEESQVQAALSTAVKRHKRNHRRKPTPAVKPFQK